MDLKRIFIKDACPTKIGGQAIIEGIMMRGADRTATVIRLPDRSLHIKTEKLPKPRKINKIPVLRGVAAFVSSLVIGTKILMYSADVLEAYEEPEDENGEKKQKESEGRFSAWFARKFGEKALWNLMIYSSVIFAVIFTVGIFIVLPTALVNFCHRFTENEIILNLIEGLLRIVMFVMYIVLIRRMSDIRRVFQFHGAEHKCIHCFENGLELTPANCQQFYTLHPRCGTSFMMFVMVISLVLFSLLGWPNLVMRIVSRLLLIPVVAGLSYELLRWAGRSDGIVVKVLSLPGLYLQKLTTCEPDDEHLEVAIAAMKAVMVSEDTPTFTGKCDLDGNLIAGTEE
ncbi:MAG: DUF1385 domain-containing protein [Eubacteriales Family XIII. Incertae Sedis bacterium]|nr:MAG: DUF1385 domain-containing protein [Clostridiales Family XIII bacterium]